MIAIVLTVALVSLCILTVAFACFANGPTQIEDE
jgi:hypothetical protein